MSPLQWALLILAVLAVIAIYLFSRRDQGTPERLAPDIESAPSPPPVRERQLDIFGAEGQQFDEFGVGKARRIEPRLDDDYDLPPAPAAAAAPGPVVVPRAPLPDKPPTQKIVALLIAEREGVQIQGPDLHAALAVQGLRYGARQIYHRMHDGEPVFSVASLIKPGHLDPMVGDSFSTPGLTLFLVLPGPVRASEAIRDMIGTAERLAESLNSEVFDAKRQSFTPSSARALQLEVEAWARQNAQH